MRVCHKGDGGRAWHTQERWGEGLAWERQVRAWHGDMGHSGWVLPTCALCKGTSFPSLLSLRAEHLVNTC